jgi:hypothetical protein
LKRRIAAGDAATFRTELLALMDEIDKNWANIPWSDSPQGFDWNDFTKYQTLAKYLNSVDVHPRKGRPTEGGPALADISNAGDWSDSRKSAGIPCLCAAPPSWDSTADRSSRPREEDDRGAPETDGRHFNRRRGLASFKLSLEQVPISPC